MNTVITQGEINSDELMKKLYHKLNDLKLFDGLDEDRLNSIKIISKEFLDVNIAQLKPREQKHNPVIKIDNRSRIIPIGDNNRKNRGKFKSKYKLHLMEVGDILISDIAKEGTIYGVISNYKKVHANEWLFKRTKKNDEVYYERIK